MGKGRFMIHSAFIPVFRTMPPFFSRFRTLYPDGPRLSRPAETASVPIGNPPPSFPSWKQGGFTILPSRNSSRRPFFLSSAVVFVGLIGGLFNLAISSEESQRVPLSGSSRSSETFFSDDSGQKPLPPDPPGLAETESKGTSSPNSASVTDNASDPPLSGLNAPVPSDAADEPPQEALTKSASVTVKSGRTESGRLLAHYRLKNGDGLTAIQRTNGSIAVFHPDEILSMEEEDRAFVPQTKEEAAQALLDELGPRFESHLTDHFVIIYETSANYAVWCGQLFESLYTAFNHYQHRREFELPDPEFPMTAILLPNREAFTEYASRDMPDPGGIAAYYNRLSNRVVLYDFSEEETLRSEERRKTRTSRDIDRFLARPQAAFNVMTVIHEANHQIAFNRKLFLQTGPYPLWAVEGLAMFFESPDARSSRGWSFRGVKGKPNLVRLNDLRQYLATRPVHPIREIIREERFNDDLLRSYAVSWGLYYYLQSKEPKKLALYLKRTASKHPYALYSPDERLADFEEIFGNDWDKLLQNFERFIASIR